MENILESTSIVGCSVSVLFSLSTLVVLSCYREKTRPLKMKQHFSIALTLTNTIVLAGFQGLSSRGGCRTVTILLHYAVTASFAWIFVDVYFIMSCIRRNLMMHSFWRLAFVAWGIPVPFMFLALVFGLAVNYKFGSKAYSCWHSDHVVWSLIVPCFCLILGTSYMLTISIYQLYLQYDQPNDQSAKAQRTSESTRYSVKTNLTMLLINTFIWIFGCYIFWYPTAFNFQLIFGLGNGIQGLLLFFFYCIFCLELDLYVSDDATGGISENMKYDDLNEVKIDMKSNASYESASDPKLKHIRKLDEGSDEIKNYFSLETRGSQQSSEPESLPRNVTEEHCKETKVIVHIQEKKKETPSSDGNISVIKNEDAREENEKHESRKEEISNAKENNIKWINSNKIGTLNSDVQETKPKSLQNSTSDILPSDTLNQGKSDSQKVSRSSTSSHQSSNSGRCVSSGSIASLASLSQYPRRTSRTSSNVSHISSMGLNELESLFNNPDLLNQALPRKNRYMFSSESATQDQNRKRTGSKQRHTSIVTRKTSQIVEQVGSEQNEKNEVNDEIKTSEVIDDQTKSGSDITSRNAETLGVSDERNFRRTVGDNDELNGTFNTSDNIKTDAHFKAFNNTVEGT